MKSGKRALVIVDPQNDFCDHRGSLYVEGAYADVKRLADHIALDPECYTDIVVSLDCHDDIAIFHPSFWLDKGQNTPSPYTQITAQDFRERKWRAASPENQEAAERTFRVMAEKGVESMMIWPEHCVISTWGQNISDVVREALSVWRDKTCKAVRYVFKGENPYTDQFSVFEGLDDTYPETAFNMRLFDMLAECSAVTFAGEALTHCVGETVMSYVNRPAGKKQSITLLTDCCSPVTGFSREEMLGRLEAKGVELKTSQNFAG